VQKYREMRNVRLSLIWYSAVRRKTAGEILTSRAGVSERALLLSARSTVSPTAILTSQKIGRNAKCACFVAMALGRTRQAAREMLTNKAVLPDLAPLLSARSPVSPVTSLRRQASSRHLSWLVTCVLYTVFLTRYWGIVTVPGCPRVNRPGIITWGCRILTLQLHYVAGYTGPLLFLFERTHNY